VRTTQAHWVDPRVARTKARIATGYRSLLQEMPHDRITVSQVARTAQVNRATFYRHFDTPDDVAAQLLRDFLAKAVDGLDPRLVRQFGVERYLYLVVEQLSETIAADFESKRKIVRNLDDRTLRRHLRRPALEHLSLMSAALPQDIANDELRDFLDYSLGGMVELYRAWLTGPTTHRGTTTVTVRAHRCAFEGFRGVLDGKMRR
jgi:AcrR family transcriptional regulator